MKLKNPFKKQVEEEVINEVEDEDEELDYDDLGFSTEARIEVQTEDYIYSGMLYDHKVVEREDGRYDLTGVFDVLEVRPCDFDMDAYIRENTSSSAKSTKQDVGFSILDRD